MKREIVSIIVLVCLSTGIGISEQSGSKNMGQSIITCNKINKPPVIDGILDDICWDKANKFTGFILGGSNKWLSNEQTTGYVVYDDKNLYLAFSCDEPQPDKMVALSKDLNQPVWGDDHIEIHIDINNNRSTYYHLGINFLGGKCDVPVGTPRMGTWQTKASVSDKVWFGEVSIPFNSLNILELPPEGAVWGFNLARVRMAGGFYDCSTWSWSPDGFNIPSDFGNIVFSKSSYQDKTVRQESKADKMAQILTRLPKVTAYKSKETRVVVDKDYIVINLTNDIYVRFIKDGNTVLGIDNVIYNNLPFRLPDQLIEPPILRTIYGEIIDYACEYMGYKIINGLVEIHMIIRDFNGQIIGNMNWIFTPKEVEVDSHKYAGLGYRYEYKFKNHKINRIVDLTTWELGGSIRGNTIILQDINKCDILAATYENTFSPPLQTLFATTSSFNYQMNKEGSLIVYYEKPALIKSGFYKRKNSDALSFADHIIVGENKEASTPFKYVLFSSNKGLDGWTQVQDYLFSSWQSLYGMQEVDPLPIAYLDCSVQGPYYTLDDRRILLYKIADNVIPGLSTLGFKRIWTGPFWDSDSTSMYGGSLCTPWSLDIAGVYGGEAGLKYFCDKAHQNGMQVIAWLASAHLSDISPLFTEHPDWIVKTASGGNLKCGYPEISGVSLRSGWKEYQLKRLKSIRENTGLDGFWQDSYLTFGINAVNYAEKNPSPQVDELIDLQAKLQKYGYILLIEGMGPFGLTGWGMPEGCLLAPGLAYKNSFLLTEILPGFDYYRLLANKTVVSVPYEKIKNNQKLIDEIARANNDYNTVYEMMGKRTLLGENGVEWKNTKNKDTIIFSFKAFEYKCTNTGKVTDVTMNREVSVNVNGSILMEPLHTYWLKYNER